MKALVWNYTGMGVGGGSLTVPFLKETTPLHSPNMIFLSETKNRDRIVQRVQRQLEMAHVITVEPMGLSGGLALFWNDNIQVLTGDFNDILDDSEKQGGRTRDPWTFRDFKDFIWNLGAINLFEEANLNHLDTEASNHSLLILSSYAEQIKKKRRFYFDKRWVDREKVQNIVSEAWSNDYIGFEQSRVNFKIKKYGRSLVAWVRGGNGNARKKIIHIKKQITDLRSDANNFDWNKLRLLKSELSQAYKEEDIFWKQKSRALCLVELEDSVLAGLVCARGNRRVLDGFYLGKVVDFSIGLMSGTISYGTGRVKGVEEQLQDFCDKELAAVHVAEILRKYEQSSSQVVNLDKSAICFSRNVMEGEKVEIFSLLGQQQRNEMGMYLELPAIVGRSKKKMLEFIKDRVKTKIKGWKGKFLSTAGKEVMLKSGQTEDKRKMQIEKWEILCDSKSRGGLGFRDLKAFNMALLAKQARRSWIWRSILWGRDLLVTGLRWRISDGKNINVWPNPWIPRKNGFTPKSIQMQNNLDLKVVDLIDEDTHTWKLHKISTTFEPEDVDAILSIPISIIGLNDRLLWHHSKSRNYEVKSCYYLAKGLAGKTISSSEAQNLDKTCKICGFEIEDIEHMLFRCPRSQLVWKQSPINCPDIDSIPDFSVWWYNLFLNAKHFPESTELLDLSVNLMWQIWKDTGLRCDDRHASIGVATLNSLGKPLYAHRSSIQYVGKTMTAEAIGIRKALECAITLGWKSVKILSDAKNVVDMIQKQVATSWEIEILCEDIWKLSSLLDHVEFLYIPRKLNKMTPKVPKDPNGVKAHKEVKAPKAPKQPIIPPGPYVPVAPPT
ncbi:uncharacterized protein [Nicotiana sylvestris]|uniref:uncharacterized protein n=1 Tax=Nicotiana sylvestris TaxID=4096 RepID=UPI00388C5132